MIKSPLTSPLRPALTSPYELITRSVFELNGTQWGELSESFVVSAGQSFELEIEYYIQPETGDNNYLYGHKDNYQNRLSVYDGNQGTGSLRLGTGGMDLPAGTIDIGKISVFNLRRQDSRLFVNGVDLTDEYSGNVDSFLDLQVLARNNGSGSFMEGLILSFKAWVGVGESRSLQHNIGLDQSGTSYQSDLSRPTGTDLLGIGDFYGPVGWTEFGSLGVSSGIAGGFATIERTSSYCGYYAPITLEAGKTYLIECDAQISGGDAVASLSLRSGQYGGGDALVVASGESNGKLQIHYKPDSSITRYITLGAGSDVGIVRYSGLTIREWSGVILQNALPEHWMQIERKDWWNYWLGPQVFTALSGSGWTITNSGYQWSKDSSLTVDIAELVAGQSFELAFQISDFVGVGDTGLSATSVSNFSGSRVSENSKFKGDFTLDLDSPLVRWFARDSHSYTVSNLSVRRKLEIAQ